MSPRDDCAGPTFMWARPDAHHSNPQQYGQITTGRTNLLAWYGSGYRRWTTVTDSFFIAIFVEGLVENAGSKTINNYCVVSCVALSCFVCTNACTKALKPRSSCVISCRFYPRKRVIRRFFHTRSADTYECLVWYSH